MSTWGTWGLMGVNVLLFLIFQIGVEPWRRKRLVKGFEDKVMEALEREGSAGPTVTETGEVRDIPVEPSDVVEDAQVVATKEFLPEPQAAVQEQFSPDTEGQEVFANIGAVSVSNPRTSTSIWRHYMESIGDMFSERQIIVRRVDLTTAMVEGAAAGVTIVGLLVWLLRQK